MLCACLCSILANISLADTTPRVLDDGVWVVSPWTWSRVSRPTPVDHCGQTKETRQAYRKVAFTHTERRPVESHCQLRQQRNSNRQDWRDILGASKRSGLSFNPKACTVRVKTSRPIHTLFKLHCFLSAGAQQQNNVYLMNTNASSSGTQATKRHPWAARTLMWAHLRLVLQMAKLVTIKFANQKFNRDHFRFRTDLHVIVF